MEFGTKVLFSQCAFELNYLIFLNATPYYEMHLNTDFFIFRTKQGTILVEL